ncbi:Cytosolic Fe-S cluster assembly factor NAR1 [Ceratocystis fimbriata CBS 114723]|uniref:Nuclear architecture-related protein 1 n=1 Tax=Ceratocystis fimbriata CBS 114723 TaxID=1035309 RepID=A0A2C5WYM0_9PEZI|nr:Cytosolic Fe-S cluster assembly factor NAR1 [Ceratocystis fimbriata CBS 114723]
MSAILSVDDLNDFITPGVACIKPVETLPAVQESLEHEVVLDGTPAAASAAGPAQISLTDCLACSGCVTSAEAVLVSLQSHAEVLNVLDAAPALRIKPPKSAASSSKWIVEGLENSDAKLFVASVAPQARASLAAAMGPNFSEAQAGRVVERFLRQSLTDGGKYGNAFTWVLDTSVAREACLVLEADDVLHSGNNPLSPDIMARKTPVLASACPGWVCYAEKTHPYVLPHISRTKSPQALIGTLVKTTLTRALGIPASRIYHVTVMPCSDKKLEASREELTDSVWDRDSSSSSDKPVRDIDCVITTAEILTLASARGLDIFALPHSPLPPQPNFPDPRMSAFLLRAHPALRSPRTAGPSGGSLYFILSMAATKHSGARIIAERGRNADVVEYTLLSATDEPLLRAARYYGFRNIQNLVRRLKPAKPSMMPGGKPFGSARRRAAKPASAQLEYTYVEVMACPGGCTNGGGQIKADDTHVVQMNTADGVVDHKAWLAAVDEAYFSADETETKAVEAAVPTNSGDGRFVQGLDTQYIRETLAYWADITLVPLEKLAYTTYREVVSDVGKKDMSQTERAAQIAGRIGGGW